MPVANVEERLQSLLATLEECQCRSHGQGKLPRLGDCCRWRFSSFAWNCIKVTDSELKALCDLMVTEDRVEQDTRTALVRSAAALSEADQVISRLEPACSGFDSPLPQERWSIPSIDRQPTPRFNPPPHRPTSAPSTPGGAHDSRAGGVVSDVPAAARQIRSGSVRAVERAGHGADDAAGQEVDGGLAAELIAGAAFDQPRSEAALDRRV